MGSLVVGLPHHVQGIRAKTKVVLDLCELDVSCSHRVFELLFLEVLYLCFFLVDLLVILLPCLLLPGCINPLRRDV